MAAHPNATSDLSQLSWQRQGEYQVAWDHRCLYLREGIVSMILAAIFCVAIVGSAGWLGVTIFLTETSTLMEKGFGVLMFTVVAVFLYVPWLTIRNGRWMIVFDRGDPGAGMPGEIRFRKMRLSTEHVRCLSTRPAGGLKRCVVAELHDGKLVTLGLISVSTWPAYHAQQAATWMGLSYRDSAI